MFLFLMFRLFWLSRKKPIQAAFSVLLLYLCRSLSMFLFSCLYPSCLFCCPSAGTHHFCKECPSPQILCIVWSWSQTTFWSWQQTHQWMASSPRAGLFLPCLGPAQGHTNIAVPACLCFAPVSTVSLRTTLGLMPHFWPSQMPSRSPARDPDFAVSHVMSSGANH